jgi:deoxyribodipyrimidine photo-lyase
VSIGHAPLSEDITQGKTGLPCMDAFVADLLGTGYLHHHSRMWLASYIVHHRKIDWRAAADWFEALLLDGDMASNHLSWQWITSTFSSKPYFFNKESLGRYTGEKYCANCKVHCPFDASYEVLNDRLFNRTLVPIAKQYALMPLAKQTVSGFPTVAIFVHDEMLSAAHDLLKKPFPKFFVFDPQIHGAWSLNRLQFVADCLSEMEMVEVWVGDTYEVLISRGVGQLVTQETPNRKIRELLTPFLPKWEPVAKFVDVEISAQRLKRFSRYWEKVGPLLLGGANHQK